MIQNTQRLSATDDLFHTDVLIQDTVKLRAMLDSGSMACSLSSRVLPLLKQNNVVSPDSISPTSVVLVGCGGSRTNPVGVCELQMRVFGCGFSVPTLIVEGQSDDLILGSNVMKHLIRVLMHSRGFGEKVSPSNQVPGEEGSLLQLLTTVETWRGDVCPDKVGTVKIKHAVTLEPLTEHLVWGRLPAHLCLSAGSTVVVEPSESRTVPRSVMVGRVVTPLWGDGWVPVRVINPSPRPVTLRRNCKIADVSTCVALEDFDTDYFYVTDSPDEVKCSVTKIADKSDTASEKSLTVDSDCTAQPTLSPTLSDLGLQDIDIDTTHLSPFWKAKLVDLLAKYESIFSRHRLDCGKAKDFVHRIRLSDSKPFRLPYRRLSPSHYEKLRVALNEMEERDIIRKSTSEYASPLVLVWKKNGDLRLCTDFRWLNARTFRDAHPLPHQADALAALGGNAFFSTMDLTSGYYNMEVHEEDKKFTAFTSPFGLYEYNRLPQGLCNSPATFMRMMMAIFGDQNFLSLLCYLDDILVFAPDEQLALQRLEMVFERLKVHNLKLAPKKCHFMKPSVKFLGHIVTMGGISTDPEKVRAVVALQEKDLMVEGTNIPAPTKIRSFLGMVGYYQQFFEGYSSISKPLFALTSGGKRPRRTKGKKIQPMSRDLSSIDWTPACSEAFRKLKQALLNNVTLAHPDFSRPFLLSVDASSNGLGAVLSQLADGDNVARPIAFASKSLNYAQSRYPAHRLEFLALKWAVCDKFSHWLRGQRFTVWTDNNPLTYVLSKPKLDTCEQRWVSKLAPYDFDIKYIPGPKNVVADALSREPFVRPSILHRLTTVPYGALLEEANALEPVCVQDAFRLSCDPLNRLQYRPLSVAFNSAAAVPQHPPISSKAVSAVLEHSLEEDCLPSHAFCLP
ncbi:retrovirus-related Pol polyprotein from transposon 297 [Paralichthys olivaceus]|uniref:retrovirus-related Pol polyprotein from transposon 297 n=1 Tax=Paralichthys olivaceus TaxID=8255 RepID=UPI003751E519